MNDSGGFSWRSDCAWPWELLGNALCREDEALVTALAPAVHCMRSVGLLPASASLSQAIWSDLA